MQRIAKLGKQGFLVVVVLLVSLVIVVLLIRQTLFVGQPLRIGNGSTGSGSNSPEYWSKCVNLARQRTTHPQVPELLALDDCYQKLLAKFDMALLNDTGTDPSSPPAFFTGLREMKRGNQQSSVARLWFQLGYKENMYTWERQELTYLDSKVDQGKVDPNVVKGYNAAVDRPLFDQMIKQRLPTLSDQSLDQWFTSAILAIQPDKPNPNIWPRYNPPPRIVPPQYGEDVLYHGGYVLDGTTQVYLIFWIDASFQPASPKYVSLVEQFVNDVGRTPLYANLLQYTDVFGRRPTGVRLAGTFTDTHPFPPDVVAPAAKDNSDASSDHAVWAQEIQSVAASQHWNVQDYHNLFILLPTMYSKYCGSHSWLSANGQTGSPSAIVYDPFYKGKQMCADVPHSPNQDPAADIAVDTLWHELMEAVTNPYGDGWWYGPGKPQADGASEIGDKCAYAPKGINGSQYYGIDPKTDGNVTWNGHTYILQPTYDNYRHSCVWQGP